MKTRDEFDKVREMSRDIIFRSEDVLRINDEAIDLILKPKVLEFAEAKKGIGWLPAGSDLLVVDEMGLNLFLNVINFCYKDPESGHEYVYIDHKVDIVKRATGLLAAMARSGIHWNRLWEVRRITQKSWSKMIQLDRNNPMYLGDERGQRIVEFAGWLEDAGFDTVTAFLADNHFDAGEISLALMKSDLFSDKFMKRAQLAARMMSDVLERRSGGPFSGLEKLTVMADYRVPQVFYNLGVVFLSERLRNTLSANTPITSGSREELALRATAVYIGEKLAKEIRISEAKTDNLLWGLSQTMAKSGQMLTPHMIVATDAY